MLNEYYTLKALARVAEDSPHPTQYKCTAREMILRLNYGWEQIFEHLRLLEAQALVKFMPGNTILFSITHKGLEKIQVWEGKPLSGLLPFIR